MLRAWWARLTARRSWPSCWPLAEDELVEPQAVTN